MVVSCHWVWGTQSRVSARATAFPVLECYLSFSVAEPCSSCELCVECKALGATEEKGPSAGLQGGVKFLSSRSLEPHSVLPLLTLSWETLAEECRHSLWATWFCQMTLRWLWWARILGC